MAKLKFDRVLNIKLKKDEIMNVPNDEVWKGALVYSSEISINEMSIQSVNSLANTRYMVSPIFPNIMLGGAQRLILVVVRLLQGLHLRLYNKLAKGVALA